MRRLVERRGLGRFLKLTETPGVYASHPLGGARMAPSADLGVVDHGCEVFGHEGLFCMDSSAIPTSLGVNPSLTIAAVAERAAARLVRRAGDYGPPAGVPAPPAAGDHRAAPPSVSEGRPGAAEGGRTRAGVPAILRWPRMADDDLPRSTRPHSQLHPRRAGGRR